MTRVMALLAILSACTLFVAGSLGHASDSPDATQAWAKAESTGTLDACVDFVERYPESTVAGVAKKKIFALVSALWEAAQKEGSLDGYFQYVKLVLPSRVLTECCSTYVYANEQLAFTKILAKAPTDSRLRAGTKVTFGQGDGTTLVEFLPDRMELVVWGTSGADFYVIGDSLRLRQEADGLAYESGQGIILKKEKETVTEIFGFGRYSPGAKKQ